MRDDQTAMKRLRQAWRALGRRWYRAPIVLALFVGSIVIYNQGSTFWGLGLALFVIPVLIGIWIDVDHKGEDERP